MDARNLLKNAKNLNSYEFEQKLNKLARENYRYRNLNNKNKKTILGLIKKYRPYLRKGLGISSVNIRNEMYKLHRNRIKLDLSEEDLDDIREILGVFKK